MAFRGLLFSQARSTSTCSRSTSTRPAPRAATSMARRRRGRSQASFEGLIRINPGAQQSHTYLQFHSMLLSDSAKLDAIPSVLVSADDVSASHGGTVGELDEMKIFYMQSRGLTRPMAVRVIVEGFFEPLVGQLDDARSSRRSAIASGPSSRPPPTTSSGTRSRGDDGDRDGARRAGRLPDSRARDRRAAPGLPRLGVDLAEARRGARSARRLLPQPQRQHPPRRLPPRAGGGRAVRGRSRADRAVRALAGRRARSSPAMSRRRSTSSPTPGRGPRLGPAMRC